MKWRSIIHAEGVFLRGGKAQAISSTPQACGVGFRHPERAEVLPVRRDPVKLLTEILEIAGADAEFKHFLDHRQEIGQRANRTQWRSIGPANQPAGRRQNEGVFDHGARDASLVELSSQPAVGTADGSHRSWCLAIRLQHPANILFPTDTVVHDPFPSLADRVATDP